VSTLGQMFPSKYLRALEDVPEDGLRVTITDVEEVELRGDRRPPRRAGPCISPSCRKHWS
jgi:hypothetical protein